MKLFVMRRRLGVDLASFLKANYNLGSHIVSDAQKPPPKVEFLLSYQKYIFSQEPRNKEIRRAGELSIFYHKRHIQNSNFFSRK